MTRIIIGCLFLAVAVVGLVQGNMSGVVLAMIIAFAFIAWGRSARDKAKREEQRDDLLISMLEERERQRTKRDE